MRAGGSGKPGGNREAVHVWGDSLNRLLPAVAMVLLALVAASAAFATDSDGVVLSASSWDFGILDQDASAETVVSVDNGTENPVTVSLIPTCNCLRVEPSRLQIPSSSAGSFRLRFDSDGEEGEISHILLVQDRLTVAGESVLCRRRYGSEEQSDIFVEHLGRQRRLLIEGSYRPDLLLFSRMPELRTLSRRRGSTPRSRAWSGDRGASAGCSAPGVFEEYEQVASSFGIKELRAFPALQVGDTALLQGEDEIGSRLEAALRGALLPAVAKDRGAALAVLPVLAGGLLDGINPCAFTTLIFLLSALALAGRGRREVLAIGASSASRCS